MYYRNESTGLLTGEIFEDPVKAQKIGEQYSKIALGGKVGIVQINTALEV